MRLGDRRWQVGVQEKSKILFIRLILSKGHAVHHVLRVLAVKSAGGSADGLPLFGR